MDRLGPFPQSLEPFLEPALLCQTCFILAASSVLAIAAAPQSARTLLTQYGARSNASPVEGSQERAKKPQNRFLEFMGWVTSLGQVPHSWFIHFYVLSVSSSVFWAAQYLCGGVILTTICRYQAARSPGPTMSMEQVQLAWLLMAMQGTRRLYECFYVLRTSSSSKMWCIHWLLGCAYYLGIGIAIWIEGSHAILQSDPSSLSLHRPSVRQVGGVALFLIAWFVQYRCHEHLAGLKKYTLPQQGLFRYLICPHYTCECLLYLSLAIVAAPEGDWCNRTLLCGVIFVAVNLGTTASGTRQWYSEKFGSEEIKDKWSMIPLIF
ncbi:hypothetical protein PFICI_03778 [Pestalotiopsis fici W106-1]|uniref:Polyprenal reductase n=1 Tax=Pestalotiopsis fici (strain W106-1 / CGMCC3.15140) TaxID=1229662 RepID=W3XI74_PESFW|nr:uncharacterized protein PFICI_03778 [Pestalotiopsis fici W106-1]ETS85753.1 hypothetical protein PFICI_03778 [Pestalotiopsis fici W106-1]